MMLLNAMPLQSSLKDLWDLEPGLTQFSILLRTLLSGV